MALPFSSDGLNARKDMIGSSSKLMNLALLTISRHARVARISSLCKSNIQSIQSCKRPSSCPLRKYSRRHGARRLERRSLFQKWFSSWRAARFWTVHLRCGSAPLQISQPGVSLLQLTCFDPKTGNLHIDPDKVASSSAEQWQELLRQAQGSQDDLKQFLSIFEFHFDSPEIAIQRTALGLLDARFRHHRRRVCRNWRVPPRNGRPNAILPRLGGFIHIDDVRLAAHWAIPRGFNQRFEIPPDFVPVRGGLVEQLIANFTDVEGESKWSLVPPALGKVHF